MPLPSILERKIRLDGTLVEFACERVFVEPGRHAVLRYVIPADRTLAGTDLVLAAGTVTIAHYWDDRPYNVYHWLKDGATVAYYCNVADETRIAEDRVEWLDLVVDVLITPRGDASVLDEDELPTDLDPRHRRTIAQAVEALVGGSARRVDAAIERETRRLL